MASKCNNALREEFNVSVAYDFAQRTHQAWELTHLRNLLFLKCSVLGRKVEGNVYFQKVHNFWLSKAPMSPHNYSLLNFCCEFLNPHHQKSWPKQPFTGGSSAAYIISPQITFDKELKIMRRSQNIVRHLFQMSVEMKTHFRGFKGVFLFSRAVNKVD